MNSGDRRNQPWAAGFGLVAGKRTTGIETGDPQLGKLMLYQLSYVRVPLNDSVIVER